MIKVDLQLADNIGSSCSYIPDQAEFETWVKIAIGDRRQQTEVSVRIVDSGEIQALNHEFRNRDKPTNVLSFPATFPAELELDLIGDLVICAPVVQQEATSQGKTPIAHWAHMVIHGVLHLLGYDHMEEQEAQRMEALEIRLMASLGYPNPYE